MLDLHFIGPNEINLTTFCDAGTDDRDVRQQKCAEWYVPFQHTIYDTAQQAELNYGVPITVVGFGLALTEHVAMLATSYDVVGIYNFLLFDEQSLASGWQSGLYYWNGDPEPFLSNFSS
jgi:hypothetical protein